MRSWGTSGRTPRSLTPVGPLRLAFEDDSGTGSCCFRRLSPFCRCLSPHHRRCLSASRRPGSADAHCTTTATHDNLSFEAQSRGSRPRCLRFAAFLPALSRSYSHARLASGWWPTFTGRGSRPRKVPNEVSASSTWLPPHPSSATQATSELDGSRAAASFLLFNDQSSSSVLQATSSNASVRRLHLWKPI